MDCDLNDSDKRMALDLLMTTASDLKVADQRHREKLERENAVKERELQSLMYCIHKIAEIAERPGLMAHVSVINKTFTIAIEYDMDVYLSIQVVEANLFLVSDTRSGENRKRVFKAEAVAKIIQRLASFAGGYDNIISKLQEELNEEA